MNPVEHYLKDLHEIRSSGEATDETSYYTSVNELFNAIGGELKPKVRCILTLKNRGAGHPDGGLFTRDQFQQFTDDEPIAGQKPSRGAIEVKPAEDDAWVTSDSAQVTKYWKEYGQVLVTNYRDFVLVGRDSEGKPVKLASYRLAPDEKTFWKSTACARKSAEEHGERFQDFLRLAMLSPAILAAPKDVAWVLAYYARDAKWRVDVQRELAALATVREALEQALGLKFEGDKGEHFFRSTLVQTLFYGVFSAWVLWSKQHPPTSKEKFDWKLTQWSLRVPMIRVLFEQVATAGKLGPLGLVEVLDWTAAALNRVDRTEFFTRFQEQEAVQYFYEPFLEAFDPELRKDLGVWYTPLEVVKYMVARADTVLREELGLEDGLADKNVYVLDPACGTGIRLGTAICLMVRPTQRRRGPVVRYRDFWGINKKAELLNSLESKDINADYRLAAPSMANRYSFRPSVVAPDYESWPRPIDLCSEPPISGLQEMRRWALIDINKEALEQRMEDYLDPEKDWSELKPLGTGLTLNAGRFNAKKARTKVLKSEHYRAGKVVRYALYPFDSRWAYHTNTRPLWNEPRPALAAQAWSGNQFFIVRMFAERPREHAPAIVTPLLPDYHVLRPNAVAIPFRIRHVQEDDGHQGKIKAREDVPTGTPFANLPAQARAYLNQLGVADPDHDEGAASLVWLHALAVTYSPFYLRENGDGVRRDWPRIPLPASNDALLASAKLGKQLTLLLNTEASVQGVTAGAVRPELKVIGNIAAVEKKSIDPATDLNIDVGWGHEGKDGITMPGKGKLVERDYIAQEYEAIREGAKVLGLTLEQALVQLGEKTCDVYLNDRAYWKNIPSRVWDFTIGGYQVIKKWLSYREAKLLERGVTVDVNIVWYACVTLRPSVGVSGSPFLMRE